MCIRLRTGESSHIKSLTFTFTHHLATYTSTHSVSLPLFPPSAPAVILPQRPPSFRQRQLCVGPGVCRFSAVSSPPCSPGARRLSDIACRVLAPASAAISAVSSPPCSPGARRLSDIACRVSAPAPAAFSPSPALCRLPLFPPSASCPVLPMAPAAFFAASSLPFVAPGAFPTSPACRVPPPKISPSAVPAAFPPSAAWRVLPRFRRHLPLFARCFSDVTCRVPPTAPAAFPPSPALCCHVSAIFELK